MCIYQIFSVFVDKCWYPFYPILFLIFYKSQDFFWLTEKQVQIILNQLRFLN